MMDRSDKTISSKTDLCSYLAPGSVGCHGILPFHDCVNTGRTALNFNADQMLRYKIKRLCYAKEFVVSLHNL